MSFWQQWPRAQYETKVLIDTLVSARLAIVSYRRRESDPANIFVLAMGMEACLRNARHF